MKSGGMPAGLASTAALAASNREEYRELGPLIDLEVLRKEGAAVEDRALRGLIPAGLTFSGFCCASRGRWLGFGEDGRPAPARWCGFHA
jgi:hypothetical protein